MLLARSLRQTMSLPDEVVKSFSDPLWRLSNLYYIMDKSGRVVKFAPNKAQKKFLETLHYQNLILKARQRGFSTVIVRISASETPAARKRGTNVSARYV